MNIDRYKIALDKGYTIDEKGVVRNKHKELMSHFTNYYKKILEEYNDGMSYIDLMYNFNIKTRQALKSVLWRAKKMKFE